MAAGRARIESISTGNAPEPKGHYAQAIVHGGLVHVSGQLPLLPDGSHQPEAGFDAQVRTALDNLFAILRAAGSDPGRLLKVTAYIVGVENWPRFNAIYAEAMGEARPARSVVPVPELHYGYLIEIDAVAAGDCR
ncbi:RidA family protein [Pseudoxanthomonas helianthi]|uniref:RidA family protein n=1 Tax=Pseudoxanthomonas helianthi TaxID=1453541 RepID=A0A941AS55_9GAMM|nr:RidA family protein [Pseudoxanthomonas helianthi]MBP3982892.1 RidA family protein [Pseudoxanthomonas helianthi]